MLMLYRLLRPTEPVAAEAYLERAFQLVRDTLGECKTADARLVDGKVDWGEGAWETILQHSTINGNRYSPRPIMDHGLVCEYPLGGDGLTLDADYYLAEFANEALKLRPPPN